MASSDNRSASLSTLTSLAAFVIIIAGMRAADSILVPFLLSGFIAIMAAPPMFWLEQRKIPTPLAIIIVITVIAGFTLLIATLIGTSLNDFTQQMPEYQDKLQSKIVGLIAWLNNKGVQINSQELLNYIDPGKAMQLASGLLRNLANVLSDAFLIILTVIFILAEASSFPSKLRAILGPQHSLGSFQVFLNNMKTYIEIKTIISLITGGLVWVWLFFIGVDYALLWGILAFLLNYVPTIGSILAAIPAILLALVQLGVGPALLTGAGYVAVNIGIGNGVEPRFMGRGLGLSTLVVFLSLLFWGWVLGPVGMLLSVPLTMTIKIALDSRDDTRWLAIVLGPEQAVPAEPESANTESPEPKPSPQSPNTEQAQTTKES